MLVCLGLASILGLILGASMLSEVPETASVGLAGSVLASALVALYIDAFQLAGPGSSNEPDISGTLEEALRSGLMDVDVEGRSELAFKRLEGARQIEMFFVTARRILGRYQSEIRRAIVENGCDVRILIADPTTDGAGSWSSETREALCPGMDIPEEIRGALSLVRQLVRNVDEELTESSRTSAGSVEVRHFLVPPPGGVLVVDADLVRVVTYLPFADSSGVPAIHAGPGPLLKSYRRGFRRVWDRSEDRVVLRRTFDALADGGST